MSLLHTVNKSPFERDTLDACLRRALDGAAILLIEDGVYAALEGTEASGRVRASLGRVEWHVLGPDLDARGLDRGSVIDGVKITDYAGFVALAATHHAVQAWL